AAAGVSGFARAAEAGDATEPAFETGSLAEPYAAEPGEALAPSAAALVAELTELTAAHPYDERFRAQLIRALRADGRQA
ncbi:BTAD domain-containing putative transcriptional regulator, partial [Streptomyces sp. DT225]